MEEVDLKQIDDMLASGAYRDDPYPLFKTLREADPVHWCGPWNAWLVTRHSDVETALGDPVRFSNVGRLPKTLETLPEKHRQVATTLLEQFDGGLQHVDPPDHTRIREPISGAFGPAKARALRGRVQEMVDQLLDRVIERGAMDVVAELAAPLPLMVLGVALDLAPEECEQFGQWDDDIAAFLASRTERAHLVARARDSANNMVKWLKEVTERRRRHPGPDLITTLTKCADAGSIRGHAELYGTYLAVLMGAHETAIGLISSGLLSLLRNPDQLELLRKDPALTRSAVEEFLRYESPVMNHQRIAAQDITFGTAEIKKGQMVIPVLGSANRDPAVFADADRLDITRKNNRHFAFGRGVHFCLGAPLARMEGAAVFSTLLRRLENIRLATDQVKWQKHDVFRILESLPVEFEPA